MDTKVFLAQIDQLLATYEDLKSRSMHDDLSDLTEESARLALRLQAAFDRMTTPGDTYNKAAEAERTSPNHIKVVQLSFLAYAFRDDIRDGWLLRAAELVHASTSAEMLEMATDLSDANYKDAAAVVTGTTLELHLRTLATKHGAVVVDNNGKPKKTDVLRADLRKLQVTSSIQDKRILVWLGIRNDAAHGNYSTYTANEVKSFITELSTFVDTHPA